MLVAGGSGGTIFRGVMGGRHAASSCAEPSTTPVAGAPPSDPLRDGCEMLRRQGRGGSRHRGALATAEGRSVGRRRQLLVEETCNRLSRLHVVVIREKIRGRNIEQILVRDLQTQAQAISQRTAAVAEDAPIFDHYGLNTLPGTRIFNRRAGGLETLARTPIPLVEGPIIAFLAQFMHTIAADRRLAGQGGRGVVGRKFPRPLATTVALASGNSAQNNSLATWNSTQTASWAPATDQDQFAPEAITARLPAPRIALVTPPSRPDTSEDSDSPVEPLNDQFRRSRRINSMRLPLVPTPRTSSEVASTVGSWPRVRDSLAWVENKNCQL